MDTRQAGAMMEDTFTRIPFTKEYLTGNTREGDVIITHEEQLNEKLEGPYEAHEVQVYKNTPQGMQAGLRCTTFDTTQAQEFILELLSEGPLVHDIHSGKSYRGGLLARISDEADYLNTIAQAGYDHEMHFGTIYTKDMGDYTVLIRETVHPCYDNDLVTLEVSEIRSDGVLRVRDEACFGEEESTKMLHDIMRSYLGLPRGSSEKAGRLTQTLYWRGEHGYRKIAERGHELTAEDKLNLEELYHSGTLHFGDQDRTPVRTLTTSIDDLIR